MAEDYEPKQPDTPTVAGRALVAKISQDSSRVLVRLADDTTASIKPGSQLYDYAVQLPDEAPRIVVPQIVSKAQACAALEAAGLLATVEAAVAASPDPLVQIAWDNASVVHRDSPFLGAMAVALGITENQLDAMFVAAAAITF